MEMPQIYFCNLSGDTEVKAEAFIPPGAYKYISVDSLKGLKNTFADNDRVILIAFCGDNENACLEASHQIISENALHKYPLLAIGYHMHEIEKIFRDYFKDFTSLNYPTTHREVVEILEGIRTRSDASEDNSSATLDLTMELAYELQDIPENMRNALFSLTEKNTYLGGDNYEKNISLANLASSCQITFDDRLQKYFVEDFTKISEPEQRHFIRTAFVSCKLIEQFDLDATQKLNVTTAAVLLSSGFAGAEFKSHWVNYYDEDDYRLKIASHVKDSAYYSAVTYGCTECGNALSGFAKLLANEPIADDHLINLSSSTLLISELIDRICFNNDNWDPQGAYRLLRKFKAGFLKELQPDIWACGIKFLSEAIPARASVEQLPLHMRLNEDLLSQIAARQNAPLLEHEKRVPVMKLVPGMRLAQPLTSIDGRTVLAAGLRLDQDLLWRVWQLAAIRPLDPAVILKNDD